MYLNVYVPVLQSGGGASVFFRDHRGEAFATAQVISHMTRAFVAHVERFAGKQNVPIVPFEKGVRTATKSLMPDSAQPCSTPPVCPNSSARYPPTSTPTASNNACSTSPVNSSN
jgi:hypothetical protein